MLAESCLLPRAAVYDETSASLFVACTGPGRLFKIATKGSPTWSAPIAIPNGVTGIAIDAGARTVVAWSTDDRAIASVPMDARVDVADAVVAPGGPAVALDDARVRSLAGIAPDAASRGRAIFYATNDPDVSSDGRACASCHVDGGDDALTWPTPEGPRQTPTLAGRIKETAPYGWTGKRRALADHLKETIKRLGGRGLDDAKRDDLVAFLAAMPTPPRARVDEALAARGRAIFASDEAKCQSCHAGTMSTDQHAHDVKSKGAGDLQGTFDTPSLAFSARSAPYFHDGRYPTLRALLRGSDGSMGKTKHLSDADLEALEAYVLSL
jgi:cytochrome c peroxidase